MIDRDAWKQFMSSPERRRHRRLLIEFDLSCRQVGSPVGHFHAGRTVNVSPGGLYFETDEEVCKPGNLVEVSLSIPARTGVLEFGGKIAGLAKVLRVTSAGHSGADADLPSGKYGVALQLCERLRLRT